MLLLEFRVLRVFSLKIKFLVLIDMISLLFGLTVAIITLRVLFFSNSYIIKDKTFIGFHIILLLFVLSILLLIFRPNLISGIIGWDGLGLTSYLLVIYYTNSKAYNSGIITALTNRIGDILFLILIALILEIGEWDYKFYRQRINFFI